MYLIKLILEITTHTSWVIIYVIYNNEIQFICKKDGKLNLYIIIQSNAIIYNSLVKCVWWQALQGNMSSSKFVIALGTWNGT